MVYSKPKVYGNLNTYNLVKWVYTYLAHKIWVCSQINELKNRLNDDRYLVDIGVSRKQVHKQIEQLKGTQKEVVICQANPISVR